MTTQTTRAQEMANAANAASGTFPKEAPVHATRDPIAEAHRLACEVEVLLTPTTEAGLATEAYGRKIARAMARSLIDQLSDLARDSAREADRDKRAKLA
jgi:hypothetical protein